MTLPTAPATAAITPDLKARTLAEALPYIRAFSG
jgi:hypothetical protein